MPDLRTHGYRVAQWATGTIGTHALRSIIEHPHLELTAVHVFGADKVGTDAGELCGLDPAGISATDNVEAIVDAGINVVSTGGQFHHPPSVDPGLHSAVPEACARGNATLYATGSSPGFITEAIPLTLTSVHSEGQSALAAEDTAIRAGHLAAGTVAAQRITVSGFRSGRQLLRFQAA